MIFFSYFFIIKLSIKKIIFFIIFFFFFQYFLTTNDDIRKYILEKSFKPIQKQKMKIILILLDSF